MIRSSQKKLSKAPSPKKITTKPIFGETLKHLALKTVRKETDTAIIRSVYFYNKSIKNAIILFIIVEYIITCKMVFEFIIFHFCF